MSFSEEQVYQSDKLSAVDGRFCYTIQDKRDEFEFRVRLGKNVGNICCLCGMLMVEWMRRINFIIKFSTSRIFVSCMWYTSLHRESYYRSLSFLGIQSYSVFQMDDFSYKNLKFRENKSKS